MDRSSSFASKCSRYGLICVYSKCCKSSLVLHLSVYLVHNIHVLMAIVCSFGFAQFQFPCLILISFSFLHSLLVLFFSVSVGLLSFAHFTPLLTVVTLILALCSCCLNARVGYLKYALYICWAWLKKNCRCMM